MVLIYATTRGSALRGGGRVWGENVIATHAVYVALPSINVECKHQHHYMATSPSPKARAKSRRKVATQPEVSMDAPPIERKKAYHGDAGHRFQKGNPGRALGAKAKVPRSFKKMCQWILSTATTRAEVRNALRNGITRGGARHADRYLRLVAEYNEGKPVETQQSVDTELHDAIAQASESLTEKLQEVTHALKQQGALLDAAGVASAPKGKR